MDIVIRDIDPIAIKKIDELAKKQNISRNSFLVNMIQNYTALEEFKSFEDRYQSIIDKCLRVVEKNTEAMQKVLEIVEVQEWNTEKNFC